MKQLLVQPGFQVRDLATDSPLRHTQLIGRLGEAGQPRHSFKRAQGIEWWNFSIHFYSEMIFSHFNYAFN